MVQIKAKLVLLHLNSLSTPKKGAGMKGAEHNATVDSNQDIDYFYGLSNKLVLRANWFHTGSEVSQRHCEH
ncbi:hypothetical protein BDW68DRAFT_154757 [Aspergillus falconensis]